MKRATSVGRSFATLLAMVMVLALAVTALSVEASAAASDDLGDVVEVISLANDGTFRPMCAKYAIGNVDAEGNFSAQLMPISGYKPVQCWGWAQKGEVTAEVVEAGDGFDMIGRVINNTGAHDPARVIVFYDRDVETVSFATKYYADGETEPGMGAIAWQEKDTDGFATFELPINGDKTLMRQIGIMEGVEAACNMSEDGKLDSITIRSDKDLVVSVYNKLNGYVDYILTSNEAEGAIVLTLQRCKLMVAIRHYVTEEEAEYGENFEVTIGDDGYSTVYLPVQEGLTFVGGSGVSDVATIDVVTDDETGYAKQVGATIDHNLVVDIYHDVASGVDKYILSVDGNKDLGEVILTFCKVNVPFDGPEN